MAVLVGLFYAIVGVAFALPATHVRAWRLAAWLVSIIAFVAQTAYERFVLRSASRSAALHVAIAAGLGAFGLAVGANVHAQMNPTAPHNERLLLIALVVWPVITALPAFVVAFGISSAFGHLQRRPRTD